MGRLSYEETIVYNNSDDNEPQLEAPKNSKENMDPSSLEMLSYLRSRVSQEVANTTSTFQTKEYKDFSGLMEKIAFFQICQALFIDMKWSPTIDQEFRLAQFIEEHALARTYNKLVLTLLRRLVEHGILVEKGEVFKVVALSPNRETIRSEIKRIQQSLVKYPNCSQDVMSSEYFGSNLYPVISGKETGLKIMYPSEKDTLNYPHGAKSLYRNSYRMKLTKVIPTVTGVQEYLETLTNNNEMSEKIKILEIGAGTGGITIPLLESFPKNTFDYLEYEFTDISTLFIGQAKAEIESKFPENVIKSIGFKTLDIEMDPKGQGFELASYDIVIAGDVFHATKYLDNTLKHTRGLLKPNGLLVLGEMFQARMEMEISFGITSGWWNWSDDIRKHSSPLLSPIEWNQLLQKYGFVDSFTVGDGTQGTIFAMAHNRKN